MRNLCRVQAWTGTASGCLYASKRLYHCTNPSSDAYFSDCVDRQGHHDAAVHEDISTPVPLSSSASRVVSPERYRRRSSDPQTLRERVAFRRDYKFAKHRPLPDAPWRQLKLKTYLDDAERLYGRKETWHTVEDAVLREKLVAILLDYLRDTLAAARLEAKEARKYHHLCSMAAKQYRAHVSSGAFGLVEGMEAWAQGVLRGRAPTPSQALGVDGNNSSDEAVVVNARSHNTSNSSSLVKLEDGEAMSTSPASLDEKEALEFREKRRRRGEQAVLAHTAAMADLPDADGRHTPQSAFPFLRRRAVEDESTLDPSLVDWTAKYFPEDDARTFAEPPRLRTRARGSGGGATGEEKQEGVASPCNATSRSTVDFGDGDGNGAGGAVDSAALGSTAASRRTGSVHARHRLQRTLRDHENRHRATFDAEGIYYKVCRQSEVEERAPKPQAVKASDMAPAGRRSEVVKVPWNVAAKAKGQGYSSETLRAKERLIRLTRGEDPETIP